MTNPASGLRTKAAAVLAFLAGLFVLLLLYNFMAHLRYGGSLGPLLNFEFGSRNDVLDLVYFAYLTPSALLGLLVNFVISDKLGAAVGVKAGLIAPVFGLLAGWLMFSAAKIGIELVWTFLVGIGNSAVVYVFAELILAGAVLTYFAPTVFAFVIARSVSNKRCPGFTLALLCISVFGLSYFVHG